MRKRYNGYLLIIILSILSSFYLGDSEFYLGVKYIFGFRVIEIMISVLFTFCFFKVFLDSYYYIVLSRNNIISRLGRKNYSLLIMGKLLMPSCLLFIINVLCDFILVSCINYYYVLFNIISVMVMVILLPKKKEYDNELLIITIIMVVLKLIVYNLLV